MGSRLIHIHGLLASDKNFPEQMKVDLGIPQYAVNYWPFVEGKGYELVEKITNDIATLLLGMFPEDDFIFHGNSAGGVLVGQLAIHPKLTEKTKGVIFNCSAGLDEELGKSVNSIFGSLSKAKDKDKLRGVIHEFVQIPVNLIPDWLVEEIYDLVVTNRKENLPKLLRRGAVFTKEGPLVQAAFNQALSKIVTENISRMVIGGRDDTVTPPTVIQKMASILNVEPLLFSTGHIPHIQEPELFTQQLQEFIHSLS